MSLSMGPSHPSTHGVLRIQLELDGEVVTKAATRSSVTCTAATKRSPRT
jgi:NADH:ubiquinone oxidoreductase subunit D